MNWHWWFLWSLALIDEDDIHGVYYDLWYEQNLRILQEGLPFSIITRSVWVIDPHGETIVDTIMDIWPRYEAKRGEGETQSEN